MIYIYGLFNKYSKYYLKKHLYRIFKNYYNLLILKTNILNMKLGTYAFYSVI